MTDPSAMDPAGYGMSDFFVSYDDADRPWADWIGWHLEQAGYRVAVRDWDRLPGSNKVFETHRSLGAGAVVVAVVSGRYLASTGRVPEWTTALDTDPSGLGGSLFMVRIEPVELPGILRPIVTLDLFDLDASAAEQALISMARCESRKPLGPPRYPGPSGAGPTYPGTRRFMSNMPGTDLDFTGRGALLEAIAARLNGKGESAGPVALYGLPGVGKTQLAVQYVDRHRDQYDVVLWVQAQTPGSLEAAFADLAQAWGLWFADYSEAARTVRSQLARRNRWLLVFDNVVDPDQIKMRWRPPDGAGHILLTTRSKKIAERLVPDGVLEVGDLGHEEAAGFFRARVSEIPPDCAGKLADDLGGLPLAMSIAAAYLHETGIRCDEYRARLRRSPAGILDSDTSAYSESLTRALRFVIHELDQDPARSAAGDLIRTLAFFAPTRLAVSLDPDSPGITLFDPAMMLALSDLLTWSIVRKHDNGLWIHRLVQAIVRDDMSDTDRRAWLGRARALAVTGDPGDPSVPTTWHDYRTMTPHVGAIWQHGGDDRYLQAGGACESVESAFRDLVVRVTKYHFEVGQYDQGKRMAQDSADRWERRLGSDDPHTLAARGNLGRAHIIGGEYEPARHILEDVYRRQRKVLGKDDRRTLATAVNLVQALCRCEDRGRAWKLGKKTLKRQEAALGPTHVDVLTLQASLGGLLSDLGRHADAVERLRLLVRKLEETPEVGENHPRTLGARRNLGIALHRQGLNSEAFEVLDAVCAEMDQLHGDDNEHEEALATVETLANVQIKLGETVAARTRLEGVYKKLCKSLGEGHPRTLQCKGNLAVANWKSGRAADAGAMLREVVDGYRAIVDTDRPSVQHWEEVLRRIEADLVFPDEVVPPPAGALPAGVVPASPDQRTGRGAPPHISRDTATDETAADRAPPAPHGHSDIDAARPAGRPR